MQMSLAHKSVPAIRDAKDNLCHVLWIPEAQIKRQTYLAGDQTFSFQSGISLNPEKVLCQDTSDQTRLQLREENHRFSCSQQDTEEGSGIAGTHTVIEAIGHEG